MIQTSLYNHEYIIMCLNYMEMTFIVRIYCKGVSKQEGNK